VQKERVCFASEGGARKNKVVRRKGQTTRKSWRPAKGPSKNDPEERKGGEYISDWHKKKKRALEIDIQKKKASPIFLDRRPDCIIASISERRKKKCISPSDVSPRVWEKKKGVTDQGAKRLPRLSLPTRHCDLYRKKEGKEGGSVGERRSQRKSSRSSLREGGRTLAINESSRYGWDLYYTSVIPCLKGEIGHEREEVGKFRKEKATLVAETIPYIPLSLNIFVK